MWSSRPAICPLAAATISLLWLTMSPSVSRNLGPLGPVVDPNARPCRGSPGTPGVRRERTKAIDRSPPARMTSPSCGKRYGAAGSPSRAIRKSQVLLCALCVVVTLVVIVVMTLVTLVVIVVMTLVAHVVKTLVVAERIGARAELFQVDLAAGRVDDLGLLQNCRERLAAGDLSHHGGDLAALLDGLGELVGVHAVLLGRHHEVLDQLGLADADLLLLGDRVEQELRTHGPPGVLVDLGAVLVILEAALTLEVLVDLGRDERVGDGNLGVGQQVIKDLVPGLDSLFELLGALGLRLDVGLELLDGVELRSQLGEVVVELWQDPLFDRLDRHGDLSVLALAVAAGQGGREGLG